MIFTFPVKAMSCLLCSVLFFLLPIDVYFIFVTPFTTSTLVTSAFIAYTPVPATITSNGGSRGEYEKGYFSWNFCMSYSLIDVFIDIIVY